MLIIFNRRLFSYDGADSINWGDKHQLLNSRTITIILGFSIKGKQYIGCSGL